MVPNGRWEKSQLGWTRLHRLSSGLRTHFGGGQSTGFRVISDSLSCVGICLSFHRLPGVARETEASQEQRKLQEKALGPAEASIGPGSRGPRAAPGGGTEPAGTRRTPNAQLVSKWTRERVCPSLKAWGVALELRRGSEKFTVCAKGRVREKQAVDCLALCVRALLSAGRPHAGACIRTGRLTGAAPASKLTKCSCLFKATKDLLHLPMGAGVNRARPRCWCHGDP